MTVEEFMRRGLAAQEAVDDLLTYSVGDYVWAVSPWARSKTPQLARVEDARPISAALPSSGGGFVWWRVRVRLAKRWTAPVARRVAGALSPNQIAHNRKLGLIPAHGDPL